MPIKICIAKTPKQIDEVFKIRHKVFCEEEGKLEPTPDGRILDRFDTYPTSTNLMVMNGDEVIGSMRLTLDSSIGIPGRDLYDLSSYVSDDSLLMICGMSCITTPYRNARISLGMLQMACYFALHYKVSHIITPINPNIAILLDRIGFKILGEKLVDPHTGLTVLPSMLNMNDLNDFFIKFAEKNNLQHFIKDYESLFYQPGEEVIRAGEEGNCIFIIIEGKAEVKLPNSDRVIGTLQEGDTFGELALLTDDKRSVDVVAKTNLRVMTLANAIFMEHLLNDPKEAVKMMKYMGKRIKELTDLVG